MRYSSQVKPISYLKANAAALLTHLAENLEPLVITQNGEPGPCCRTLRPSRKLGRS